MEDLKQDVAKTNTEYRQLIASLEQQRHRDIQQISDKRKDLDQLDKLNL